MPDPVSREEKGKWFRELLVAQEKIALKNENKYLGKTFTVRMMNSDILRNLYQYILLFIKELMIKLYMIYVCKIYLL